jgi:hypothetical protein
MALTRPPIRRIRVATTHRLIPSRYPTVGIFDDLAAPEDVQAIIDLEGWTNDRLQAELGQLRLIDPAEWAVGRPSASVVMAAFCHPSRDGSRFTSGDLGAWYAAFTLETAHAEAGYHRRKEFDEVGRLPIPVQMREYRAGFHTSFHDVRPASRFPDLHDRESYARSRRLGVSLRRAGSNGIVYESVRSPGSHCLVAFRPKLVLNVRQGHHFEYRWQPGSATPDIKRLR